MLLLFDIDRTLLLAGDAGRRSLTRAFRDLYNVENALDGVRLDGSTDPLIVEDAFALHLGQRATRKNEVLDRYLGYLEEELAKLKAGEYEVMEGAHELLRAAEQDHVLGLATGNVERGARLKLAPGKLNEYFSFGGFGSDAQVRSDIVKKAIARGQQEAEARFGRQLAQEEIFVLGDTEHDVTAAQAAEGTAVGVLAASRRPQELEAAQPELLVKSLADPVLWRAIGL